MKKLTRIIFLVLTLVTIAAHAETREIVSMSQILDSIDQNTLLIFDLDNTVMEPIQTLGTDQWFHYLVNKGVSFGLDNSAAILKAVPLWESVQRVTTMVPVENQTPGLIRQLQQRGIHAMALTARPVALISTTLQQLQKIGVDFTLRPPYMHNVSIGNNNDAAYIRGVASIGPLGDKGQALVEFLNQTGIHPSKVIFIDDTLKNVVSVETALSQTAFEHITFRYGYDDSVVRQFNGEVADREWTVFSSTGHLISDAQALQTLK